MNNNKKFYTIPEDCNFTSLFNNEFGENVCVPEAFDYFDDSQWLALNAPKKVVWKCENLLQD